MTQRLADVILDGDGPAIGSVVIVAVLWSLVAHHRLDLRAGGRRGHILIVGLAGVQELRHRQNLLIKDGVCNGSQRIAGADGAAVGPPSTE